MNHGGESAGVAADLELRQRLDQSSSEMTPAAHAIADECAPIAAPVELL